MNIHCQLTQLSSSSLPSPPYCFRGGNAKGRVAAAEAAQRQLVASPIIMTLLCIRSLTQHIISNFSISLFTIDQAQPMRSPDRSIHPCTYAELPTSHGNRYHQLQSYDQHSYSVRCPESAPDPGYQHDSPRQSLRSGLLSHSPWIQLLRPPTPLCLADLTPIRPTQGPQFDVLCSHYRRDLGQNYPSSTPTPQPDPDQM